MVKKCTDYDGFLKSSRLCVSSEGQTHFLSRETHLKAVVSLPPRQVKPIKLKVDGIINKMQTFLKRFSFAAVVDL